MNVSRGSSILVILLCLTLISVTPTQGFFQKKISALFDISKGTESLLPNISDANETAYNDMSAQIGQRIKDASKYESPEAKSLLSEAESWYNLAISTANTVSGFIAQGASVYTTWNDALFFLQIASELLDKADAKEQAYQNLQQQRLIQIVAGISLVIVAIAIVVFLIRKNRKRHMHTADDLISTRANFHATKEIRDKKSVYGNFHHVVLTYM